MRSVNSGLQMLLRKQVLSFSIFQLFLSSFIAPASFAASVETVGDLKVSGVIESTSGGFKFPDGSSWTTSGLSGLLFNVGFVVDDSASNTGNLNSGAIKFGSDASGEGIASQRTSGVGQNGLDLYTNSLSRLFIGNNGNIGIGTRTPGEQLEITGNLRLPATTASTGIIKSGTNNLLHSFGNQNFFSGVGAGNTTMTGGWNTGVGRAVLSVVTSGGFNSGMGSLALMNNSTGTANTAVGYSALYSNTTGGGNTAIGNGALNDNVEGTWNTAVGSNALSDSTGYGNTAIGYASLQRNTTSSYNTATGRVALGSNLTGSSNAAYGDAALYGNTSGSNNTALGYQAGQTGTPANANTTGSNNTFIGYNAGPGTATQLTNATAIGANALVSANNSLVLGGTGANAVKVGIGTQTPAEALDVVGNVKISGTLTPGSLSSASIGSAALADAAVTTAKIAGSAVTVAKLNIDANVNMHDKDLSFRGDDFHGLGWYGSSKLFAGNNLNGPALYGNSGGALGTVDDSGQHVALSWSTGGNVSVSGEVESQSGGFKFPDGTVQTTASVPPWGQKITSAARWVLVLDDNAALDRETGLVWQRTNDSTARTWDSAQNYCYNLSLGGRKGWRPPSIEELSSLVDPSQTSPALPAGHPFTNVYTTFYWSSTTYAGDSTVAWSVRFQDGYVTYNLKSSSNYIRCVRGGQ